MSDHDGNPAARQAGYPVGEERDPDPPALEQGAGRDLTRPPDPAAAATAPRGSPGRGWPDRGLPPRKRTGRFGSQAIGGSLCYRGRSHAHLPPEDHNTLQSTALARLSSRLSGATQMHRQGAPHRPIGGMTGCAGALWRWVFRQAGRPAWRDSSRMSEVASAITGIPRRTGGVCLGGGRIGRAKLWRDGSRRGWVAADLMPVVSAG